MKSFVTYMAAGVLAACAFNAAHAQSSTTDKSPSTVDGKVDTKSGQKLDPGTVGGMGNAVGSTATSPEDVKRQTEGKPTLAEEAKGSTSQPTSPKSDVTKQSPGTVGAAPGSTAPMSNEKR